MSAAKGLALNFLGVGLAKDYGYSVDWTVGRPLVWVNFSTNAWDIAGTLEGRLVMANLLPQHRVYFAVGLDDEQRNRVKSLLASSGDKYDELKVVSGKKTVARNLFEVLTFGRRVPYFHSILVASTTSKEVVEAVFENYGSLLWNTHTFPFLVSREEPKDWLKISSERGALSKIPAALIEGCRCVFLTRWDHGIDMISDKVTRVDVEQIAAEIAAEYSLQLMLSSV